jgi:hypothetical protein
MKKYLISIPILFLGIILGGVWFTQIVSAKLTNPIYPSQSWIAPYMGGFNVSATNQTFTLNQVIATEFENQFPAIVDALCYVVGTTAAGNVRGAIYGPITSRENLVPAPLLVESASTAQSAAGISTPQCLTFASTTLPVGRYYAALQSDDGTATYNRQGNQSQIVGYTRTFNMTFGAFPTVATTSTATGSGTPGLKIRLFNP